MTLEIKGTKPGRDAAEGAERYVSRSADRLSAAPYYAPLSRSRPWPATSNPSSSPALPRLRKGTRRP